MFFCLLQYPENQPEYPVIVYKYFVEFNYVEDKDFDGESINVTRKSSKSNKSSVMNEFNQINYRGSFFEKLCCEKLNYS